MSGHEAKDFYTGIVAPIYGALRSVRVNPDPYARFVASRGEPALELGCGDGDPLLELRRRGLDVEGLDSSADMLAICEQRARDMGVSVVVHHQPVESMDLDRTYKSIFLAGPTFNLLPDDDVAGRALERIRAHLDPAGTALVPLFIPSPTPPHGFGQTRESTNPDGTVMRFTTLSEERDDVRRTQSSLLRYELVETSGSTVVERPWLLHWHTQEGFAGLASQAGLEVAAVRGPAGGPAQPTDEQFTFILTPAP